MFFQTIENMSSLTKKNLPDDYTIFLDVNTEGVFISWKYDYEYSGINYIDFFESIEDGVQQAVDKCIEHFNSQ